MAHQLGVVISVNQIRPVLIALATFNARLILVVKIPPAKPYSESFAILIASASSSNFSTTTTGPKISSCAN